MTRRLSCSSKLTGRLWKDDASLWTTTAADLVWQTPGHSSDMPICDVQTAETKQESNCNILHIISSSSQACSIFSHFCNPAGIVPKPMATQATQAMEAQKQRRLLSNIVVVYRTGPVGRSSRRRELLAKTAENKQLKSDIGELDFN